jgi:hypothetical protein
MSTADKAFGLIAMHKKLLSRSQLKEAESEFKAEQRLEANLSLEQFFRKTNRFSANDFQRILNTRARHGRACIDCGGLTFLLPGQRSKEVMCEQCGGDLIQGRFDNPAERAESEQKRESVTKEYHALLERLQVEDTDELYIEAASLAVKLKQPKQALQLLDKALKNSPGNPAILRKRADITELSSEAATKLNAKTPRSRTSKAPAADKQPPLEAKRVTPKASPKPRELRRTAAKPFPSSTPRPSRQEDEAYDSAAQTLAFSADELDQSSLNLLHHSAAESLNWSQEDLNQGLRAGSGLDIDPEETACSDVSYEDYNSETYHEEPSAEDFDFGSVVVAGSSSEQRPGSRASDTDFREFSEDASGEHRASQNTRGALEDSRSFEESYDQAARDEGQEEELGYHPEVKAKFAGAGEFQARTPDSDFAPPLERGVPDKSKDAAVAHTLPARAMQFHQWTQESEEIPQSDPKPARVEDESLDILGKVPFDDTVPPGQKDYDDQQSYPAAYDQNPEPYEKPKSDKHIPVPTATAEDDELWDEEEFAAPLVPFKLNLFQSLALPFSPLGLVGIIFGGLLMSIFSLYGFMGFFFAGIPYLYVYSYFSKIINHAARGKDNLPSWPDITESGNGLRICMVYFVCSAGAWGMIALIVASSAPTFQESRNAIIQKSRNQLNGKDLTTLTLQDVGEVTVTLRQFVGQPLILALWAPPRFFGLDDSNSDDFNEPLLEMRSYKLLSKVAEQHKSGLRFAMVLRDPDLETDVEGAASNVSVLFTTKNKFPGILSFIQQQTPCYVFVDEQGKVKKLITYNELYDYDTEAIDELAFLRFCTQFKEGSLDSSLNFLSVVKSGVQVVLLVFAVIFTFLFVIVYYPLAATMASLLGNWAIVFNVPAVLRTMFLMKKDYFLKFIPFWIFVYVLSMFTEPIIQGILGGFVRGIFGRTIPYILIMFFISTFLNWAIWIYGLMVTGNVLGRLYYRNQKQIDWF